MEFNELQDINVTQNNITFTSYTLDSDHRFETVVDENGSSKVQLFLNDTRLASIDTAMPISVEQDLQNDTYKVMIGNSNYTIDIMLSPTSLSFVVSNGTSQKEFLLPVLLTGDIRVFIPNDEFEGRIEIDLNVPSDGIIF